MKLFFFASISSLILLGSCSSSNNKKNTADTVPEIAVTNVKSTDTIINNAYVANLQAVQNTEIRSRVHGFLDKILIDEGEFVTKGQPLFLLNAGELIIGEKKAKANLDIVTAEAKSAALDVERVTVLVEKKVITKTELELAKAKLNAAQAKVSEANAALSEATLKKGYSIIKSPFDGTVNRLPLKIGSLVEEGTMLTSVADTKNVFAYFSVSENEYLRFNKSKIAGKNTYDSVMLVLSDGSNYPFMGIVETMNGEIDPSTGSLTCRARFNNPKALLKHGATGKVLLQATINNTIIIPQKAVFEIQDKNFVYIVDKNNTIKQKSFEPIQRLGQFYLVKAGLQEGEKIVLEGIQNLRDGDKIKPKQTSY
jgi:membrane fusion protein, multidrug efflux system